MAELIQVEVAYAASVDRQWAKTLKMAAGVSIEEVIRLSGVLEAFPEIDLTRQKVGVFGRVKSLDTVVMAGDRVEIYRPLVVSPMEARRAKAAKSVKK